MLGSSFLRSTCRPPGTVAFPLPRSTQEAPFRMGSAISNALRQRAIGFRSPNVSRPTLSFPRRPPSRGARNGPAQAPPCLARPSSSCGRGPSRNLKLPGESSGKDWGWRRGPLPLRSSQAARFIARQPPEQVQTDSLPIRVLAQPRTTPTRAPQATVRLTSILDRRTKLRRNAHGSHAAIPGTSPRYSSHARAVSILGPGRCAAAPT